MGNAAEAKAVSNMTTQEDISPPPPYVSNDATVASSSSAYQVSFSPATGKSKVPLSPSLSLYHPMPNTLSVYSQIKFTQTAHLGDSTSHKLYAFSTYYISGGGKYDGKPCMILHNGPSNKDPALATVAEEPNWTLASTTSIITLPPLNDAVDAAIAPQEQSFNGATEIMRGGMFKNQVTFGYRFSIEIDHAGTLRREDFEWQKADKSEMSDAKAVFKLVRLSSETVRDSTTENGSDCVAITGFKWAFAWNKPFRFEFVGDGATGGLGDRWSVMALVTAMRIWTLYVQRRVR
ncbi:hypothetical protein CGLO_04436 [Colletotrichum gloeosporioides Cg-14]|uniref:Uncharacterized protein n=1 Tax=Colletotrichum gloeosporioides (strain Cg-14) TaxID=1237896 RepID=T0M4B7_COLGC|nr:hypothetical protein CGLO_04436 [Colletotrichum gloeosporioides Cg-14]